MSNARTASYHLLYTPFDGGGEPPVNAPPTASFTVDGDGLVCALTDTSSDGEGTVVAWSWTFGDEASATAQDPSHTYATAGAYTVGLTVRDDDGGIATSSRQVVAAAPPVGDNSLAVAIRNVRGSRYADLTWSGATSTNVHVHRDGAAWTTTAHDGTYTDASGKVGGTISYRVCEAGTSTCSNDVIVAFRGPSRARVPRPRPAQVAGARNASRPTRPAPVGRGGHGATRPPARLRRPPAAIVGAGLAAWRTLGRLRWPTEGAASSRQYPVLACREGCRDSRP